MCLLPFFTPTRYAHDRHVPGAFCSRIVGTSTVAFGLAGAERWDSQQRQELNALRALEKPFREPG